MFALVWLRLWDDLEDVLHDKIQHPKRILCQCEPASLAYAYGYCSAGLAISCMFIAGLGDQLIVFVAALVVVIVTARLRRRRNDSAQRLVFAHLILLKVPALVISLAQSDVAPNVILGRAVGLAGIVGAYEVIHDAEARRSSWTPIVLAIDMVCLVWGLAKGIIEETGA